MQQNEWLTDSNQDLLSKPVLFLLTMLTLRATLETIINTCNILS